MFSINSLYSVTSPVVHGPTISFICLQNSISLNSIPVSIRVLLPLFPLSSTLSLYPRLSLLFHLFPSPQFFCLPVSLFLSIDSDISALLFLSLTLCLSTFCFSKRAALLFLCHFHFLSILLHWKCVGFSCLYFIAQVCIMVGYCVICVCVVCVTGNVLGLVTMCFFGVCMSLVAHEIFMNFCVDHRCYYDI